MKSDMKFFGSVTVGERGQVVIPADVRNDLSIDPADKLLIFQAPVDGAFVVAKPEAFEKHVEKMSKRANELKKT